jgi:REP element-mobilizing transposase RayT
MDAPGTWFITKCLEPKMPLLIPGIGDIIAGAIEFYAHAEHLMVAAFCVMPDHWHLVGSPNTPSSLSRFMAKIDRWIGGHSDEFLQQKGCAWQDGYHDIRVRSGKQFRFFCGYTEANPVEEDLAEKAENWHWSSANARFREILTRPWPWSFEQDVG